MNNPESTIRTCTKCGLGFPATREFFYPQRKGLRAYCKECARALTRAWGKANPTKKAEADRAYAAANPERITKNRRAYQAAHAERLAKYYKEWRAANPDLANAFNRAWVKAHPEAKAATQRRWREAHPERALAVKRAYVAANRAHVNLMATKHQATRRAREYGAIVSETDYAAILLRDGMVCHICSGVIESMADLHFDHVIPLAKGGPHAAENIRPSHALCNMKKGARLLT